MTALRHPNVVLFMAACTKLPKMFIVMEFMTLGSLYEVHVSSHLKMHSFSNITTNQQLLHNELIPDLPMVLRIKMVYQAAKGMHFLHSSGPTQYSINRIFLFNTREALIFVFF